MSVSWKNSAANPQWNPQERDYREAFRELATYLDTITVTGIRTSDNRVQGSDDGSTYKTLLPGADVYDIRDLATNVMNGNSTNDTDAYLAAIALTSNASNGSGAKPGVINFPRGTLSIEQGGTLYGSSSTAMAWRGVNGRSGGPDGTVIRWKGPAKGVMLHAYGLNSTLFEGICFYGRPASGTALARFCVWLDSNQVNGGSGSSDVKFRDCTFTSFGYYGCGVVVGDEIRATLTVSGAVGTFQVGELVLDQTTDGVATVGTWNGSTSLYVKEMLGSSFTTPGTTIVGMTSGATATVTSVAIDANYPGSHQVSEAVFDHCHFLGTQIIGDNALSGWAGLAAFSAGNTKDFEVLSPRFDGTRYGVDGFGSGYLKVRGPAAGNIGHSEKGALCRVGPCNLEWGPGDFENGGASCRARIFDIGQLCTATITQGEYFGLLPSDGYAIKNSGVTTMIGTKLGADSGTAKIQLGNGSLTLLGCSWREDFTGSLPVYDGSNNPIGGNGSADYSRGASNPLVALGCLANIGTTPRVLPNLFGTPLSPLRNQLWDNGITNNTVVQRGALSCSDEVRTLSFTNVKAQSGSNDIALTPGKAIIRGIVIDVTQVFSGGLLSAVTMSVGIDSDHTKYMAAKDVFTSATQFTSLTPVLAPWTGDYLKAFFTFTGATSAALTQGSVTVYVLYEKL